MFASSQFFFNSFIHFIVVPLSCTLLYTSPLSFFSLLFYFFIFSLTGPFTRSSSYWPLPAPLYCTASLSPFLHLVCFFSLPFFPPLSNSFVLHLLTAALSLSFQSSPIISASSGGRVCVSVFSPRHLPFPWVFVFVQHMRSRWAGLASVPQLWPGSACWINCTPLSISLLYPPRHAILVETSRRLLAF